MSVSKIFAVCFPEKPTHLHCATRRKVAVSIPDGVVGKFSFTWSFRLLMAPAFDSFTTRNEYQSYLLGDKGGRCVGLTTLSHSCANYIEIWEPHPLAILWVCIRPVKGWLYLALPTYFITRWHRPSIWIQANEEEQKVYGCQPLASYKRSLRGRGREELLLNEVRTCMGKELVVALVDAAAPSIKAPLHGSPRLINTVESNKVNHENSSFQRKWSTGLTGEQVGDGQLSFNVFDSLWVTHHGLRRFHMGPPGWSTRLNQWNWIQRLNDTVYTVPQKWTRQSNSKWRQMKVCGKVLLSYVTI